MTPVCSEVSSQVYGKPIGIINVYEEADIPVCCLCDSTTSILGDYVLTAEELDHLNDSLAHIPCDRIKDIFEGGHVLGPKVKKGMLLD